MNAIPDILQCLFNGLAQGSIYAIVALGFTIIFSSTQVVNFAQGEFVMLGAMGSYWLTVSLHWPIYAVIPAATMLAVVAGMALGWVLMRPLQHASVTGLIIITVGASMLLQGIASHFWGAEKVPVAYFSPSDTLVIPLTHSTYKTWKAKEAYSRGATVQPEPANGFSYRCTAGGTSDATPPEWPTIDGITATDGTATWKSMLIPTLNCNTQYLWVMGLAAAMMIGLTIFFNHTMIGKAMRAVSANRHGARLIGVNVSHMVIGAFALSASMGAIAGAAIAPIVASYDMGTMMGLKGFAAAIVGGLGNFPGSIMAGLLLGLLETFGARYLSSQYQDCFAFIILLAVLFINPRGLLAVRRRKANG